MVRPAKVSVPAGQNAELEERSRLKRLAYSKRILSESAAKPQAPLGPSKTVLKHHGKDIIKKSQRKNRFLFSFPGLLAPISGGKIGELKDLGTKNPILYLDFPQGQMKLFGTIVYPKNRYLTLQFSRGGKNVMCEDYFDNLVVFSDAWWIGRKEDNPQEAHLEFPKEIIGHVEHDFKGGVSGSNIDKSIINKNGRNHKEKNSPEIDIKEETSDDDDKLIEPMQVTPVRHSERNSGKRFSYVESSPEEDSVVEEKILALDPDPSTANSALRKDGSLFLAENTIDIGDAVKKAGQSCSLSAATKEKSMVPQNNSPLVQPTISTFFKKASEKKVPKDPKTSSSPIVSEKKSKQTNLKRKSQQGDGIKEKRIVHRKRAATRTARKGKEPEVEVDDIEEISSFSEGTDGSGEEWVA
ncbi:hypothetical protein SAY87_003623 [Trapa incisa]|uniref:DNA-binding protein RHL1 n=1 Tax=Trapa incisa TaxID=236973 RepID=A0AAN7QHY0_9MYRT|nr:hypothetical protein SAY87_003623 [Trapa incisa]